jgi:LCP family protein required for cell wall assembly
MSTQGPPQYTKYRARPPLLRRRGADPAPDAAGRPAGPGRGGRRPITRGRVLKWLAIGLGAWIGISLLLFLVSAQIQQGRTAPGTDAALAGGGLPIRSPTNVLILGSDQRPADSQEPGANTQEGRSDSILLLRVGGGANSRLSIARDTVVDIPGAGRQKVNAAYAIGGAPLAISTVSRYLGVEINHVIEVNFSEFPDLIDAMGGIHYKGGCVVSRVNGGYRRGGVTVRIPAGKKTHLNGRQALALARVRTNECNPRENDLTRARRQQRILGSMRGRALGPAGFIRLPLISWQVPRTFRSDMSGPTLMAVLGAMAVGGSPEVSVLGSESGQVPEDARSRAVERFLRG